MFRDLREGSIIYVLDRQSVDVSEVSVMSVSNPHFDIKAGNGTTSVVDVKVNDRGNPREYALPDTSDIAYSGNLVLSTSSKGLLPEVVDVKKRAEQILASVEASKTNLEKADALIIELDPEARERNRTESRLTSLESGMDDIKAMLKQLLDKN